MKVKGPSKFAEAEKNFDGVQSVADMLKVMDPIQREKLLGRVKVQDPDLAQTLSKKLFSFEDLKDLPSSLLQTLLRKTTEEKLAMALRGASDHLVETFFRNLSTRAVESLKQTLESQGPQKRSLVSAAQQEILLLATQLTAGPKDQT